MRLKIAIKSIDFPAPSLFKSVGELTVDGKITKNATFMEKNLLPLEI